MKWNDLWLRVRALARHGRAESELDEELCFHMEMEARKARAAGLTDEEARRSAQVHFGGVEQVREECREVRGLTLVENIARDLRFGARILRKTPVFTAIAVLSLAIGIGANTAVFSVLDTVLLRMLPVRQPEQLAVVTWGAAKSLGLSNYYSTGSGDRHGGWSNNVFPWPIYAAIREYGGALHDAIGFSPLGSVSVLANGMASETGAMVVSGNYFSALGVQTILGRPIVDDDDTADGLPAAVISYRYWDRVFAGEPSALGKTISVNGHPCTIAGVAPKQFFGVSAGGFMGAPEVDVMLPIRFREAMQLAGQKRVAWFLGGIAWVQVIGRLEPGAEAAGRAELARTAFEHLAESQRTRLEGKPPRIFLAPGSRGLDGLRRAYREPLLILMGVVAMTLLMACANLAGLLLARAAARQREIMVRMAVGASRARLVRQLFVEGAVLSGAGTAAAVGVAWWGVRILRTMAISHSGAIPLVSPEARVFLFTGAIAVAATFLFALAPALRATRVDVAAGLKEDTAAGPAMRAFGAGNVLVAFQVAVALVLLTGATLFARSLSNLRSLPLGFDPHKLVLFDIAPGQNGYDDVCGNQLYARVQDRLNQTAGVVRASLSANRLISGWMSSGPVVPEGRNDSEGVQSDYNLVGPDFFDVMGIPLVMGRGIEARDIAATPRVAVLNETLARACFGDGSPLGRRFHWSWRKDWDVEVVGVVKDAKFDTVRGKAPPTAYVPYTQAAYGFQPNMAFEVRIAGSAGEGIAAIRRAVADVDRKLPLIDVKTQETQIDDTLAQEHAFATLVGLFSIITLALACVGLYGAVAYTVTRRTRELGVRMALGAGRIRVLRMLLRQVALTVAAGLAIGLPATWMLTRLIGSQLYGIQPHDPWSLVFACACVGGVAALAALPPARRAMRIDPVRALRYE